MRRNENRLLKVWSSPTILTTGIWLSRAVDSNVLIMDVEGTDSRERGDEQVLTFILQVINDRISSAGLPYSPWLFQKSSL
jgi:hypothetical protein